MKNFLLSLALIFTASLASATTVSCERLGNSNNFRCPVGDTTYKVEGASSKAEAEAAALAFASQSQGQTQGQAQGQNQSQVAEGGNAYNGGNSVEISNPKHTTSMSLGVGINFSVPIASGVQTRNAIDTANWFIQNGDACTAFKIMAKAPRVRNLKINYNCGDKG